MSLLDSHPVSKVSPLGSKEISVKLSSSDLGICILKRKVVSYKKLSFFLLLNFTSPVEALQQNPLWQNFPQIFQQNIKHQDILVKSGKASVCKSQGTSNLLHNISKTQISPWPQEKCLHFNFFVRFLI